MGPVPKVLFDELSGNMRPDMKDTILDITGVLDASLRGHDVKK